MTRFLFWFQLILAYFYTIPLIDSVSQGQVKGLTLAMYVFFLAYLLLGFSLAVSAYRQRPTPSRERLLTVIIFGNWLLLVGLITFFGCLHIPWRTSDSYFAVIIGTITVVTLFKYRGVTDPMCRGLIAVWCKAIPQLWLSYTLWQSHTGANLKPWTVWAANGTGIARLLQIVVIARKTGFDRPTKGLLLGEVANVVTWGVVTIVWLLLPKE